MTVCPAWLLSFFFTTIWVSALAKNTTYYSNPLIPKENLPDPGVIVVTYDNTYYVVTTSGDDEKKFPIHSSTDFVDWKEAGYIFDKDSTPSWAKSDFWAPEIHKMEDGHHVVYFAARDSTGLLCVGAAVSKGVTGPFKDIGQPLVRNSTVGNIDPTYYFDRESKQPFLIWKEDGNGKVPPETYTPIWLQPLTKDGTALEGKRVKILENDPHSWEGNLVEAPWLIKTKEQPYYYLFYSANGYATPNYAIGVARSKNILGPFEKYPNNPIVHSNSAWDGPGHCSVVADAKDPSYYIMMYHSWIKGEIMNGYPRVLMMDSVLWTNDGWPVIRTNSPSIGRTPTPPH